MVIPFSGQRRNENQPRPPAANSATLNDPQSSNSIHEARQLFQKAVALFRMQHYAEAIPLLRQADSLAPGQASIHHYLGYALWKQDQWNSAEAEFEKAHQLDPRNPYSCYFLARIAQSLGQLGRAATFYQDVLSLGPAIYDTDKRLGEVYLDEGKLSQAKENFEAALSETPWDGSLYYELGRIDQRERHTAQAHDEFAASSRLKNIDQASIRRLLRLGEAIHSHQMDQVQALRTEVLNTASTHQDPEILDSEGVLLGRGGLYSEAIEPFERAIALAPNSFEPHFNLGLTLLKLGRTSEAEAQLHRALKLQPDSPEVNKGLAVIYVNQDNNREAVERLRAANQAAPDDPRILALLGQQYLAGHYVANAVACLQAAINQDPDSVGPRYLLIEAYQQEDNFQGAFKAAQETAQRFPHEARAVYEAGQQLANLGNYQGARPYAEKSINMDPALLEPYDLMGDILSKSGQYKAALSNFRKAKSIAPTNEPALNGIAESLIKLQLLPEALSELQQAVTVRPDDSQLYFDLVQVYMRLGQRQKAMQAETMFQKLHSSEVAARNAQAPRSYPSPSASDGRS